MSWYYAHENKPVGPVEDEAFERLVSAGAIQPETLVWQEGMPNWQPLSAVRPTATRKIGLRQPGESLAPTGPVTCSQCGKTFPPDEVIRIENHWVCAGCKPIFVQRFKEGVGVSGAPADPQALVQAVLASGRRIEIGRCISRAWELLKSNFWPMVGTTLLVYLAMMACGVVPFLGGIIQLILQGPLMAGLYWYHLKLVRGEEATVKDGFAGFGPRFVPTMLTQIVSGILVGVCLIPLIVVVVILVLGLGGVHSGADFRQMLTTRMPMVIGAAALLVVSMAAMMYLTVCWMFALILAMDRGLNFWPAMTVSRKVVSRQWWRMFGLVMVAGLVGASGVILCGIGALATFPMVFSAVMVAYDDLFGEAGGA